MWGKKKLSSVTFREINDKIIKVYDISFRYKLMGRYRVFAIDGRKVRLRKELEKDGCK